MRGCVDGDRLPDSLRERALVALPNRPVSQKSQGPENKENFESAPFEPRAGRKETQRVQRPDYGIWSVSGGRSPRPNPFVTKRKKAPVRALAQIREVKVAETKGYYANRPIITYFVIYMAIISITCGLNVWVSGD
jgi:hypothetical protein